MASQLHWKRCVWGTETGVKSCVPTAGPDLSRLTGVWLVCLGTMQIGLSDKIENTKSTGVSENKEMIFQHTYMPNTLRNMLLN